MTSEASPAAVSAFSDLYRNPRVGDLIIRTSDDVEFHVYKAIIGGASVVFADMLSLPQPASPGARDSGKPAIDVAESGAVWQTLITLCYAPRPPTPEDFDDLDALRALLDAGVKYQMDVVAEYARLGLLLPNAVGTKPFAVYALGCAYKLPDVARAAARESLRFPVYFEYSPELDLLPLRAYHHLSEYRRKCGAAGQAVVVTDISTSDPPQLWKKISIYRSSIPTYPFMNSDCRVMFCGTNAWSSDTTHANGIAYQKRLRAAQYLQQLHDQLAIQPDGHLALSKPMHEAMIESASECPKCHLTIHFRVARYFEALYKAIEGMISAVDLVVDE